MDKEELVKEYLDAWNRQDVAGLLELMHSGAAFYDAFWMETCVGRDLAEYFQDAMDDGQYWYKQVGEVLSTENGVVFRYSYHERTAEEIFEPMHYGSVVLHIRDEKILTVTDHYSCPDPAALAEVSKLAERRHGSSTYTKSGMGALKMMRIKDELSVEIEEDKFYLDPDITMSQLAEKIGCSTDQLSIVINSVFGTCYEDLLDTRRVEYAWELLQDNSDDPNIEVQVSTQAGFKSCKEFRDKFTESFGVSPTDYCRKQDQKGISDYNLHLH